MQESLAARAEEAQHRGDYRAAAQIYQEMLKAAPQSAELRANLGLMHHLLGRYADAISDFQAALQEQPRLFVPNLFVGLDLLQVGKPRAAVSYLEMAHEILPDNSDAVLALGRAYKATGDLLKARKFYEKAVQVDSANPRAWLGLGLIYLSLEEEGVEHIEKDRSTSPYTGVLEAESLVSENRLNDAVARYRQLLETRPATLCLRADYGFALLQSGRPRDAEQEFRTELGDAPRCLMDRLGLARVAIGRGDMATAVRELSLIWRIDPNFLSANAPGLWRGLSTGEIDGLVKTLNKPYPANPTDNVPPEFKRLTLATLKRWRENPVETFAAKEPNFLAAPVRPVPQPAARTPERANARRFYLQGKYTACRDLLRPGTSDLSLEGRLLLAQCAYSSGDFRTAFLVVERAADTDKQDAAAWYWRTKASQVLAVNALARAGAAGPNSPAVHVMLGDVYLERKQFSQAQAEYRKAIELDPRNVSAHLGVAASLYRLFLLDKALPELKVVLQLDPQNSQANYMMADILAYRRKFAQAEPYAKAALHGEPSNLPLVHALLGKIYASQGLTAKAVKELQQSLPADHDGSLHYQIAMLYRRMGDAGAAREALRESEALRKSQDNNGQERMHTPK